MVTNWTFDHFSELVIDGCEHVVHMVYADPVFVPFEFGVIYRPRAGELALLSCTRACGGDKLVEALPLGDAVQIEVSSIKEVNVQRS